MAMNISLSSMMNDAENLSNRLRGAVSERPKVSIPEEEKEWLRESDKRGRKAFDEVDAGLEIPDDGGKSMDDASIGTTDMADMIASLNADLINMDVRSPQKFMELIEIGAIKV
jgi:hypothetical protein